MALSDDIKERLDIVDVVSQYVPPLQKAGRNYKAPCPFHTERTPSFVVFPDRQSWRCFGACATGGDVISFVMRMEKQDFSETLRLLAGRAGINMSQRRDRQEHQGLYKINLVAAKFFQDILHSPQGMAARSYLQQRGVDTPSIEGFQLGLSPGTDTALLQHLETLGYGQDQSVGAGVATKRDDGTARDLFVGRLMFPIHDDKGNMAGFGGRSLDGSEPKYLNSPRTETFDKGRILYGLHKARTAIKAQEQGVVVEGYMDVIAAHQYGFNNVVASMGTALTEHQVALLRGAGRKFVLALDPDTAGREATFRGLVESWRIFERRRVDSYRNVTIYEATTDPSILHIAVLPEGKDPDQLVRHDPLAWQEALDKALPLLEYLLVSAPDRWDLDTSEGKRTAAQALIEVIASVANPFEQERYRRKLADVLEVSLATLEASTGRPHSPVSRRGTSRATKGATQEASLTPFEMERRDSLEEHLLALLLQWPELREQVTDLDTQTLDKWENREVFTYWAECSTIEQLQQAPDEDVRQRIGYLQTLPIPPMDLRHREQAVKDCLHRLKERHLRNLKAEEALLLDQSGQSDEMEQRVVDTNEKLRQLFHEKSSYQH